MSVQLKNSRRGWKFHTHVTPNENDKLNDPLTRAFEIFLKDLLINEEIIKNELKENYSKKLIINTNGVHNKIDIDGINYPIFYKNKFLSKRKFKQRLIDYYNPIGIFVKGPKELLRGDGQTINQWLIELSPTHIKPLDEY